MNPLQKALVRADAIIAQDRDLNAPHSIVGTISTARRIGNTRNGNGKYRVTVASPDLGDLVIDTAPDSSVAIGIGNRENRETPHRFILNRRGQISHAEVT